MFFEYGDRRALVEPLWRRHVGLTRYDVKLRRRTDTRWRGVRNRASDHDWVSAVDGADDGADVACRPAARQQQRAGGGGQRDQ